jgi:N-acetylneuraminate synthase
VASYELPWTDLPGLCRDGQARCVVHRHGHVEEIAATVGALRAELHRPRCCTVCQAINPAAECNLAAIATLRGALAAVGWSDHGVEPGVVERAVHRWGAEMVEFHLDLTMSRSTQLAIVGFPRR